MRRAARPWWLLFQGFDVVAIELPRNGRGEVDAELG